MPRRFPLPPVFQPRAALLAALAAVLAAAPVAGVPGARAQAVEHPFSFSLLPAQVPPLVLPRFAIGDLDGDRDLDVVVLGLRAEGAARTPFAAVLRNDGRATDPLAPGGATIRLTVLPLPLALAHGDLDVGDVDRDGDLDLLVSGSEAATPPHRPRAVLYRNDGRGTFTDSGVALPQVFGGTARLVDLTGDGALDVLLTGAADTSAPYAPTATVLRQTGGAPWVFAALPSGLPGHAFGDARVIDADADGDLDVLLGGLTPAGLATTLFVNAGGAAAGTFAASPLTLASGILVRFDASRTGGRLDVAATGGVPFPLGLAGRGALASGATAAGTVAATALLDPLVGGLVRLTDVDDDGDDDVIVAGQGGTGGPGATTTMRLYRRSAPTRLDLAGHLDGLRQGGSALGDLDGDGDLDLVAAGLNRDGEAVGALYRNDRFGRAATPSRPVGLVATPEHGGVRLTWSAVDGAASYAVRVGTAPGAADRASADADTDGLRRAARPGPVAAPTLWLSPDVFDGPGRHYAGVQAVSASLVGSGFAEIGIDAGAVTSVDAPGGVPAAWALAPPRPAPLARAGHIRLAIPASADVTLDVVDALGRVVRRLHAAVLGAGWHDVPVDASALPQGVYVLRLRAAGGVGLARSFVVAR